jgi:hypothetical protein
MKLPKKEEGSGFLDFWWTIHPHHEPPPKVLGATPRVVGGSLRATTMGWGGRSSPLLRVNANEGAYLQQNDSLMYPSVTLVCL